MTPAQDLRPGDVITSPMPGEKKGATARVVVKVTPRTGLTRVQTEEKGNARAREIWELRSTMQLIVDSPAPAKTNPR